MISGARKNCMLGRLWPAVLEVDTCGLIFQATDSPPRGETGTTANMTGAAQVREANQDGFWRSVKTK